MYVPGTGRDEQQLGSIFSAIGKALGGVVKGVGGALGLGPGGSKEVKVTVSPGQAPQVQLQEKQAPSTQDQLEAALKNVLGQTGKAASQVPTWVWVAGAGLVALVVLPPLLRRR